MTNPSPPPFNPPQYPGDYEMSWDEATMGRHPEQHSAASSTQKAFPCCQKCGGSSSVQTTRRQDDGHVIRRRICNACGNAWYTVQPPELVISRYGIRHRRVRGVKSITLASAWRDFTTEHEQNHPT